MKFKAIIFAKNDTRRLDFTLSQFRQFHPDIHILLINNGGDSLLSYAKKHNCEYKDIPNCWVMNEGDGSFGPKYISYMFHYAFQDKEHSHVLFLETDVSTRKKIVLDTKLDMAGFMNCPAQHVYNAYFKYFDLGTRLGFSPELQKGNNQFRHTGCGGTLFSMNYFEKCIFNLDDILRSYEHIRHWWYQDMSMTVLGYISGCQIGQWSEVTQQSRNPDAAMEHGVKI